MSDQRIQQSSVPVVPRPRSTVVAIFLVAFLANMLLQYLFSFLPFMHPLIKDFLETAAVSICVLPLGMIFYREVARARESLQSKNQQLATLVEYADDAIVGIDLDRRVTFWNRGAEGIYGYTAEEMVGRHTSILIPCELEEELKPIQQEVVTYGRQVANYETTRLRKDGTRIMVSLTHSAIRDVAGRIVGTASTGRDITERKQREEAQKRAQDLLAMSQRFAHVGSWQYDLSTGALIWSDEMYRIAGLPAGVPVALEIAESFFSAEELRRSREAVGAHLACDSH
jgi:PAS domain S-box-containing protein